MTGYQVTEIGALDEWRGHFGGFDEALGSYVAPPPRIVRVSDLG